MRNACFPSSSVGCASEETDHRSQGLLTPCKAQSSKPGELNGSQNVLPQMGCILQVLKIGIFPESPPAGVLSVFIDNVGNLGKLCLN